MQNYKTFLLDILKNRMPIALTTKGWKIILLKIILFASFQAPTFASQTSSDSTVAPNQACEQVMKTGDYSNALQVCNKLLDSVEDMNQSTIDIEQQKLLLQLALVEIHHSLGNSEQESFYLSSARESSAFDRSPIAAYRWHRKMGQKYYFAKDFELSKQHLYKALTMAEKQQDNRLLAKSFNDVGLIESQLGEFRTALEFYQKSLALKLEIGDRYPIGTTLNNIGLIYTKLENTEQAIHYYEQALDTFLNYTQEPNFDRRVFNNITHVYEDLAVTYNRLDDAQKKAFYQQKAADSIAYKNSKGEQARALINIAKLQLEEQQLDSAKHFLSKASELQNDSAFDLRLELNLSWAHYYLQNGQNDQAIVFANSGLIDAEKKNDLAKEAELYKILSDAYQTNQPKTALQFLQKYSSTREAFLAQKFDADLKTIQVTIEKQQVEHELALEQIANAEQQTKIQRLTNIVLLASLALIVCIGFIVFYWFKKHKEKQSLLQNIKYHQQQLIALGETLNHDFTADPTQTFDSNDRVLESYLLANNHFSTSQSSASQNSSSHDQANNQPSTHSPEDYTTNKAVYSPSDTVQPVADNKQQQEQAKKFNESELKQILRESLVSTMIEAVSIWEKHTKTNRVELAEKSKLWTVSIDNGTLRTRSLDKYLSLEKIPLNPRWRNVAGTCHFILADMTLSPKDRSLLNQHLDSIMQNVKMLSMAVEDSSKSHQTSTTMAHH